LSVKGSLLFVRSNTTLVGVESCYPGIASRAAALCVTKAVQMIGRQPQDCMPRRVVRYLPAYSAMFWTIEAYQTVCRVACTMPKSKPRHICSALLQLPEIPLHVHVCLEFSSSPKIAVEILTLGMSSMSSFRGGYAPRRGRGRWSKPFVKSQRETVQPDTIKHPLGELLETLKIPGITLDSDATSKYKTISDLRYVASYNWRSDSAATIIVPGKEVN
jgi:hypothetical protein